PAQGPGPVNAPVAPAEGFVDIDLSAPPTAIGRVDLKGGLAADLGQLVPGVKLIGAWKPEQIQQLAGALEAIPAPMRAALVGATFALAPQAAVPPAGRVSQALPESRTILLHPEAFSLPTIKGTPGLHLAMAQEAGRLAGARAPELTAFARLSGWTEAQVAPDSAPIKPPAPVRAAAAEEAPPAAEAPLAATTTQAARPARPGPGPQQPPRPPGTGAWPPLPSRPGSGPRPEGAAPRRGTGPLTPPGAPAPRPGTGALPQPPARPGTGGLPPRPGSGPLPEGAQPRRGTGPLQAPGAPTPRLAASGPLGQPRPASGPLGRPGPAPVPGFQPTQQTPVPQGSRVALADGSAMVYTHGATARFAPGGQARLDPVTDYAESFKALIHQPVELLAAAPEKFLFLNAEARRYSASEVEAMAKRAGVHLEAVVTDLVASGQADQVTIDRLCRAHGLSGDRGGLAARDQALLVRSANLEGLVERLSLDLAVAGHATTKLVEQGTRLASSYHQLAGQLPATRSREGLAAPGGKFAWLLGKASPEARQSKVQESLAATRAEFLKLPLAVQLKVDPKLALGARYFALSPQERQALADPKALKGLIARAAEKSDHVGYIPQNLNASERRALATSTMLQAIFDPSQDGQRFRALLGGAPIEGAARRPAAPDPEVALKFLKARNGQRVWDLLDDAQRAELKKEAASFKALVSDPELEDAVKTIRQGATGAEQVQTSVLRLAQTAAKEGASLVQVARTALEQAKDTREKLFSSLGATPLEQALTEVNRQVQEGNTAFVQAFLQPPAGGLREVIGPWVWEALAPAEQQLLEQADYREHLVEEGEQLRATGASLTEEARQYHLQSTNLQKTFDLLFRPDAQFRRELATDPVGALQRRGMWTDMPGPVQQALQLARTPQQVAIAMKAVEEALGPVRQRHAGALAKQANLQKAAKQVNAGHATGLVRLLDLPAQEMQHAIGRSVRHAMDSGDLQPRGLNPVPFV
ncbi:MAG: hypothetical protein ACLGIN_04765, partial [Candidatus Sericytochromatia bacterium]